MYNIPLIKPYITQETKDKVCEVLDSGYITEGPFTQEFEEEFRKCIDCKHAIAVTSCTTGLEMALRALEVGPGDEVIVPDYTYPATADVAGIVRATIVIVDISRDTMLIDYNAIEAAITDKTKALIPVSLFGNPLDYDRLNRIKEKYGVYIVEDAACSIGAEYKGSKIGNYADISVFSLHPRKFITTGEGGLITTNNSDWADWMVSYKHFGMGNIDTQRDQIAFEMIGTNYKLSNVLAAIGLIQMKHLDELLERRRELSENYLTLLKNIQGVIIPETTKNGKHSHQSFCIYVENRDTIMKEMRNIGIEVQICTYSLHMHPAFMNNPMCRIEGKMTGSDYAYEHCLTLPLYHEMKISEQQHVISQLSRYL